MADISTKEARNHFGDVINRAAFGKERLVLTRRGKRLVALVPLEDLELLKKFEDQMDLADVEEAHKEPGTIPWEKVKEELLL